MITRIIFVLFVVGCIATETAEYHSIGSFQMKNPSFLNLGYFTPYDYDSNNRTMMITCFSGNPFAKDTVYIIEDIGTKLSSFSTIKPTLVTNKLNWPNEATAVPYGIFPDATIGLGYGFLVPGKSTGGIALIPSNSSVPHTISPKKKNWFYHVALWWDMNGDGLQDCVTARATVPTDGPSQGELVWFANPGENEFSQTWEETVVASGPDIMVELVWLDGEQETLQPQIIAGQFFSTELTLWWTENNALWSDLSSVQHRVIDDSLGAVFDMQYVDLNNDGKKDLLVTNHQAYANESAVFAYTVPENWKTDPWPRYVLATNITTLVPGPNQASPGRAWAFHPNTKQTDNKPYIVVGGDGAEVAFMLYPNSQDVNDWSYTREDIVDTGGTVGQVVVGDVDGDSWVEFFVPGYDDNTIYGYSYGDTTN